MEYAESVSGAYRGIRNYVIMIIEDIFNNSTPPYNWFNSAMLFEDFIINCNISPSQKLIELARRILDCFRKDEEKIYFSLNEEEDKREIFAVSLGFSRTLKNIISWIDDTKIQKKNENQENEDFDHELLIEIDDLGIKNEISSDIVLQELQKTPNHRGFNMVLRLNSLNLADDDIVEILKYINDNFVIATEYRSKTFFPILKDLMTHKSEEIKAIALITIAMNYHNNKDRKLLWNCLYKESDEIVDLFFQEAEYIETMYGKIIDEEEITNLKELAKYHPSLTNTIITALANLNASNIGDLLIQLFNTSQGIDMKILQYFSQNPDENAKELLKCEIKKYQNSTKYGISSRLVLAAVALSKIEGEDAIEIILENCYDLYYWVAEIVYSYLKKRLFSGKDRVIKRKIKKLLKILEPQTYLIRETLDDELLNSKLENTSDKQEEINFLN